MHYDDDTLAARSAGLEGDAALQAAAPATAEEDPALNELRRALLIYGTAGQATRPGMEAGGA